MKEKFSIFSPGSAKGAALDTSVQFKKSPNKFALYEPAHKPTPVPKLAYQSLSSTNLEHLRKLPHEYSNLRQTLSYKAADFDPSPPEEERAKPSSILRQTINMKPTFKPRSDKTFTEGSSAHRPEHEPPRNELATSLGYSKASSFSLAESKSSNVLSDARGQVRKGEGKWRAQEKQLGKEGRAGEEWVFRKKESAQECFTPKLPKYSYEQRFKKVGSPTSTANSDSRSPPNKCGEGQVRRVGRVGVEEFSLGRVLGEGKFGVVTLARHRGSNAVVALKKIPKALIRSHLLVEQLSLQIRLQSCLNHKNILGMYGFFDDAAHLYIVLEYMEQGTLYAQLKRQRALGEREAAGVVRQVAEAVEHLHDRDIAHRDIKPENIVVSNNVYKLCDFGWATLCNERRQTYCGTFDYAAPEILEGKEYDMSVDLWCLGVLTFELLTGKAPFYHLSRKETMKKILSVDTAAIHYPESMSPQAVDFIERLIRKDPCARMKAAEALRHPFLSDAEE